MRRREVDGGIFFWKGSKLLPGVETDGKDCRWSFRINFRVDLIWDIHPAGCVRFLIGFWVSFGDLSQAK